MLKNSRNVAIIQARMASHRFPGKMVARLGGIPILEWVIRRLLRAKTLSQVILATSNHKNDNALAELSTNLGIQVFRGSETDVLDRCAQAAIVASADNVVRVCADNPFIEPDEVDRLVNYFYQGTCDYACNHQDRLNSKYADGFGAEIFQNSLLQELNSIVQERRHREHITSFIWDNNSNYIIRALLAPDELAYPDLRFDVDNSADLKYLQDLVNHGIDLHSKATKIVNLARLRKICLSN